MNWVNIGPGNGLALSRPWINAGLLSMWTPGNIFQWNLKRNSIIFIQENAIENFICQNGGHFVQGEVSQWVNPQQLKVQPQWKECTCHDIWCRFLTLGLFGRRVIVVTCVCPSVCLSVCPSVCLSVPIILVNTITQSVYPISPPNLLGGFNMALFWMVL